MKIPAAKAAVNKKWEKWRKFRRGTWQSQKSERGDRWSKDLGRYSSFCIINGFLSSEKCWVGSKHQKNKGRFVVRGDIVKDNSGSYAVFTEQGSSASQMTAAKKIMDIISRLTGCDGQAGSRRSIGLYPSENGRCSQIIEIPKLECPDIWIRLPRHKWPKSWSSMEDPVIPLERNLYGHPLAGLLWDREFEKILLKHGCEKIPNWECLFTHRQKGLFLSMYVDDIKLAGKKQNLDPMWKVLNKEVDLGEPTSFLDHVNLGCTQRKSEISKDIVDNYRTMFEFANFRGKKWNSLSLKIWVSLHGLMIWLVIPRSVWNDIVSWRTRRLSNFTKYLLHASMTTTSKKKKQNLLENCQIHALKLLWNDYTWQELDDLIFFGQ